MKQILFCLLSSAIILAAGCKTDDDATSIMPTGKYALEAKVDNKLITVPKGELKATPIESVSNAPAMFRFYSLTDTSEYIILNCLFTLKPDKEDLTIGEVNNFSLKYYHSGNSWYNIRSDLSGHLTNNPNGIPFGHFTIDGISETNIWGTFSFVGYNYNDSTTVNITEGKFNAVFAN